MLFARMTPPSKPASTRAAVYAQERRDNEIQAREELSKQLPSDAFLPDFNSAGEFNLTTKTLLATLCFLDPDADIPQSVATYGTASVQYNQLRRANETKIRDRLKALVPENLFTTDVLDRTDFNPTTKVMIAASFHVKDVLQERDNADMSTSTLSDPQTVNISYNLTTPDVPEPSVPDLDEIPDSQDDLFDLQEAFDSRPSNSLTLPRPMPSTRNQDQHSLNRKEQIPGPLPTFMPYTPPSTTTQLRPSSNSKRQTPYPATENSSASSTTPSKKHFNDYDLLANLRADERDQELDLDLKPPPFSKKIIQPQGRWELRLKDQKDSTSENESLRSLEQVTARLVAKAKELVIVMEGDDSACEKQMNEAHDLCIDTIAMFEGSIEIKKYRRKWMAKRARWAKEYDLDG